MPQKKIGMADELQHTRISVLDSMALGQAGVDTVTNTSAQTPGGTATQWFCIQAIADTVIAEIAEDDAELNGTTETDTLAGVTLSAGSLVFGTFTSITLTSGKVRCYREPKT